MSEHDNGRRVGMTCCYVPLALIDAAGMVPYRVLPISDAPDAAGQILHDNLCPHVKRVLDRALDRDLPPLEAMILTTCCDAMRRLADALRARHSVGHVFVLDLPVAANPPAIDYFAAELARLRDALRAWSGSVLSDADLSDAVGQRLALAEAMSALAAQVSTGHFSAAAMQSLSNRVATSSINDALAAVAEAQQRLDAQEPDVRADRTAVPIYLFGNVLPDPAALALLEDCGARVVGEDLCTGARSWAHLPVAAGDPLRGLAQAMLGRPPCARTVDPSQPGHLAVNVTQAARDSGARGVIGHTAKFCDPYLARLPALRAALRKADLPLLWLEGDCTLRSLGQQRTRIEAFVEMLH